MSDVWTPGVAADVIVATKEALLADKTLELIGTATRRSLGRPVLADVVLDLSALAGIVSYEPEELILVALPATPMTDIQQALADRGQNLAFEPPDYGPLWQQPARGGTIGGAIMTGRAGPRRLTAGGARDHVLGVKGVNGFGEAFAAGGRVVKNVTGFDVSKFVTGSFGTLCAITELTLKVLPRPAESGTLVVFGLTDDEAVDTMRQALNETPAQISSAAHLPANVAESSTIAELVARGAAATLLRVEGVGPAVSLRLAGLQRSVGASRSTVVLDQSASERAWTEIGNAGFFAARDTQLWRLSLPPASGAVVGMRLVRDLAGRCFYDWAGGAVWIEAPAAPDAHAALIRGVLHEIVANDGYATLVRASEAVRSSVAPFQLQSPMVAALNERLRRQFDPNGVFNPGRMYERI